jgi:transposase
MIHMLKSQGLSVSAIARRSGLDRKTVRRYLESGTEAPCYGPRAPRACKLDAYREYLQSRVEAYPGLSAQRLFREIKAMGYTGGYTRITDWLRKVRPESESGFERRFETPAGFQAQVDFARFVVRFRSEPALGRIVWLFSMVLGHSRYLFGRFVWRQTLDVLVRCHLEAFAEFGGAPRQILYDRMKTAVLGESEAGAIIYNPTLLSLGAHYGFEPRACQPYRAKTKGKVERPFRYVRQDFFLGREFEDMEDLNDQFDVWRAEVANAREHGTTRRIVSDAFAEEQGLLLPLPAERFGDILKLERRVSHEGMVSVDGNLYSVPDTSRARIVEVQQSADEVRLIEAGRLIAVHPVLTGRGERRVAPGHRRWSQLPARRRRAGFSEDRVIQSPGAAIDERPLAIYEAVGQALAGRP